jgi:hypothetical protein
MAVKRDGATVSAPKEAIAWELVKLVYSERQKCYIEQEHKVRGMVDAYRQASLKWDDHALNEDRPSADSD